VLIYKIFKLLKKKKKKLMDTLVIIKMHMLLNFIVNFALFFREFKEPEEKKTRYSKKKKKRNSCDVSSLRWHLFAFFRMAPKSRLDPLVSSYPTLFRPRLLHLHSPFLKIHMLQLLFFCTTLNIYPSTFQEKILWFRKTR